MKNISVLIKPASGACNMTCDYCFYCDEAAKREQKFYGMMSEETLKNMIRRTMLHSEGSVSYTWQGGEPTLRGLDFFRKALYLQKKYNRNHLQVINAFQTNGYGITDEKCEEMHISMKELFELIPKNLRYAAGGTELADLLWVINGTSSLLPRDLDPDSYAYEVWKCQRAIQEIFIKDLENEEEKILSLLQMPRNRRKSVMDPIMKKLAKFTLFLPARIVLFLYTEFTGDNFWEIWSAIKSGAYHDEKMKKYASKELELYRKIFIEGPIAPVTTSDFLSQDGYFTFWETPSELVGEENYYISDWDRLYWWGKIEDVEITEEIDIWLNMLVKEYEMILKGKEQETENAFVDHIFNTMEYLNSFYGRIYLFKEFYNALLNNSHEVRYQAILDLLDKFGEKNKEIGRVYQKYGNKEWCILSKNLKCNRGRMEIKRIIGVMANKELRKKYFGF